MIGSEERLAAAVRTLRAPGVRTGVRRIDPADVAGLFPSEADHVRAASPTRRFEFASGRALLRDLLGQQLALPVDVHRRPSFPPGTTGSLSHDGELVVAAVSESPAVAAIGIDLEPATLLEPEVAELVVRPDDADIDPHLLFTLKEAAYKAWSSLGGAMLEFHDVRVLVSASTFVAEVVPTGSTFDGRWTEAAGRWLAFVVVTSREAPWAG